MSLLVLPDKQDLVGRLIALNSQTCRRFQCGGFHLGPQRPFAVVEPGAQQDQVRQGLLDGRLLDITDQNKAGLQLPHGGYSPARELAGDEKKVYFTVDNHGNLMIVAPRDKQQEDELDRQIATDGVIHVDDFTVSDKPLEGVAQGRIDSTTASQRLDHMANALEDSKAKNYKSNLK